MAEVVQELTKHVEESSGSDFRTNTSFGLPGYGTGHAKFCNTNYDVQLRVYDDLSVQCRVHGQFTCPNVLNNHYDSVLVICPAAWKWSYSSGHIVIPDKGTQMASARITVGTGVEGSGSSSYTWDFDSGWKSIGKLTDFGGSDTGVDGSVWVSGTCTYEVTDPVYPTPVKVTVPGFLRYLGFHPWARYQDGQFKSCNRTGGNLQIYKGSAYRDIYNSERDSSVDQAHYYKSGAWASCPKIGTGV